MTVTLCKAARQSEVEGREGLSEEVMSQQKWGNKPQARYLYRANSDTGIGRCKGPVLGTWFVRARHSKEVVWLKQRKESGGQMFSYVGRGRLAWSLMGSGEDLGFGWGKKLERVLSGGAMWLTCTVKGSFWLQCWVVREPKVEATEQLGNPGKGWMRQVDIYALG